MKYIGNGFSAKMLDLSTPKTVKFQRISQQEFQEAIEDPMTYSIIGHSDLADELGVPMNRVSITLTSEDKLYLVLPNTSRLPEGKCELKPEEFTYSEVEVTE